MKHFFYLLFISSLLGACAESQMDEVLSEGSAETATVLPSSKLSLNQAMTYASIFSGNLDRNDSPDPQTRASAITISDKVVQDVDFLIENGDTLLYAINYKDKSGFILIAGDNSSFPILAHSSKGNINFDDIEKKSATTLFINSYKDIVKQRIHDPKSVETTYYENWKDIGQEGVEYEVTICDDEPTPAVTRARRESSGKESIYPYTGKELNYWSQEGGYNICAPNRACIGCPAIAIGMLMYDTSQRLLGNSFQTHPSFSYFDQRNIKSVLDTTSLARKLKQIADSIPNYNWGKVKDAASGAHPNNILIGLKKLGYQDAQLVPYDFETLYENLSFKGYNYFGKESTFYRGVLIGAYSFRDGMGHIWFCDGYYEQSYTVTKKKFFKTTRWKEYDDRLYMNWGWGPESGNGWYLATDREWTSLDGKASDLKYEPKMFINLSKYVNPKIHSYVEGTYQ